MLDKIVTELETELNKLPPPTQQDFQKDSPQKAKKKEKKEDKNK